MFLGMPGGRYCNNESTQSVLNKKPPTKVYPELLILCKINYANAACNSNGHNSLFCRTYKYTLKTKLYENIDTWMDNHDHGNVNQYSRTDLMQTKALIIFDDRAMSITILLRTDD